MRSSIEKTRFFNPHMSARWAQRFYARVHFQKIYPGGASLKCWLADLVNTRVSRETLVHDLCSALARGALSDRCTNINSFDRAGAPAGLSNSAFVRSLSPSRER